MDMAHDLTSHPPQVTVLMTVYNGERYLRPAMESILGQTFTDFEFLIIDDGSTDSSVAIIRSYHDPRIRLYVEPHRGFVSTLNRGLALARGRYIARMDADDLSDDRRLAVQVAFLDAHPRVVLVSCTSSLIDAEGKLMGRYLVAPAHEQQLRTRLRAISCFAHGSVVLLRRAI